MLMTDLQILRSPPVGNAELNALFAAAWTAHKSRDFQPALTRSLAYLCARHAGRLIGFVNVAWDGGHHAFLLDPTVHPDFQRQGIGTRLLNEAAAVARESGGEWLHVDFEPELERFYRAAGYRPTAAGLLHLRGNDAVA